MRKCKLVTGYTLQHYLVAELGRRIVTGAVEAGEVLVIDQVGRDYRVSQTVVRDAFRGLGARGLIRPRHRVGTTVLPQTSRNLLDPELIFWRNGGPKAGMRLRNLAALREGVEPLAAVCAAVHAGNATTSRLTELHADTVRAEGIARLLVREAREEFFLSETSRTDGA